jgi:RHS repeat-associated protein
VFEIVDRGVKPPRGQTADMNLDGFVDSFDYDEWDLNYTEQGSTARGVLAQSNGSAAVNRIGYAGYFFDPSTQQYLVRNRELDPNTGVWDERDPMGYHDGSNLYMYVRDNPINAWDPMGLKRCGSSELSGEAQSSIVSVRRNNAHRHDWSECVQSAVTIPDCYNCCITVNPNDSSWQGNNQCLAACSERFPLNDRGCCEAIKQIYPMHPRDAYTICCNGRAIICMPPAFVPPFDFTVQAILNHCMYRHERFHQSRMSCDSPWVNPGNNPLELACEECLAYQVEFRCLWYAMMAECRTDHCRQSIANRLDFLQEAILHYCATCGQGQPNLPPVPRYIPWLSRA